MRETIKLFAISIFLSVLLSSAFASPTIDDVSQLNKTVVGSIVVPLTELDIQEAVLAAKTNQKRVSISGSRHSQGGHIMIDDAVVLDMSGYNDIVAFDLDKRLLTVESGITWEKIQNFLNTHDLSVSVQQSSNIFTVGGSLSANIHGRDPRYGPIIQTVYSFKLVTPNAEIINVSRTENPEFFSLVIGGYGLFGVITEVTLEVTQNSMLQKSTELMKCDEYVDFLESNVFTNSKIELHYARPDIRAHNFMNDCSVTSFESIASKTNPLNKLQDEKYITVSKWLMNLSRKTNWGKSLRWKLQGSLIDKPGKKKIVSRNNAMRPPVKFLEYYSPKDTDILQEYFVPVEKTSHFMNSLKAILSEEEVNVLSITLRYLKANDEAILSYSGQDSIGIVLYINHDKDYQSIEKVRNWTRKLITLALKNNGTYYLTYANYATKEQLNQAYPRFDFFMKQKRKFDPDGLFMNKFYKHYQD